jgi:hypothetical protein
VTIEGNGGAVELSRLMVDPARLAWSDGSFDAPIAFIDLDRAALSMPIYLPPCPVIGLGNPDHPAAAMLDGVIEPPVTAQQLAGKVLAQPHAAETAVGLLRLLPSLSLQDGLTAESLAYGMLQGSEAHHAWLAATQAQRPPAPDGGRVAHGRHGNSLMLTLDNPARGNAVDRAMRDALYSGFALAAIDPEVSRVILRAQGRTFSLGAELGEFGTTRDPAAAHAIRARTLPARMIARCADRFEAHIQGACVGAGLEMAAWARRITATPDAWFQLPELAMGIIPGAGGCVSLTRRIGRSRAALLILSGRRLSSRAALDWGLIDAIVDEPA